MTKKLKRVQCNCFNINSILPYDSCDDNIVIDDTSQDKIFLPEFSILNYYYKRKQQVLEYKLGINSQKN